jgi:DNA-binding NarL/FixJ family response regulator
MDLIILTTVRLLGDGLAASLASRSGVVVRAVVSTFDRLARALEDHDADLVLIDVTQGIDTEQVRAIAQAHPYLSLVALGLDEQRQDVIRCGRAGFIGYVTRDAPMEALCKAMDDAMSGRLACPAEISGGLLRALFNLHVPEPSSPLSHREDEVMRLIERGLSNKEIARELCLSVSTVKHHVHHILAKLEITRRTQAITVRARFPTA